MLIPAKLSHRWAPFVSGPMAIVKIMRNIAKPKIVIAKRLIPRTDSMEVKINAAAAKGRKTKWRCT